MCKLLILGAVDTVAVGFSSFDRYSGPRCWLGALIRGEGRPDAVSSAMVGNFWASCREGESWSSRIGGVCCSRVRYLSQQRLRRRAIGLHSENE